MEPLTLPRDAHVTVTPDGQVSLPKDVLETLHLTAGANLRLQLRGEEIVLTKESAWVTLEGAASADTQFVDKFTAMRRDERAREDKSI